MPIQSNIITKKIRCQLPSLFLPSLFRKHRHEAQALKSNWSHTPASANPFHSHQDGEKGKFVSSSDVYSGRGFVPLVYLVFAVYLVHLSNFLVEFDWKIQSDCELFIKHGLRHKWLYIQNWGDHVGWEQMGSIRPFHQQEILKLFSFISPTAISHNFDNSFQIFFGHLSPWGQT